MYLWPNDVFLPSTQSCRRTASSKTDRSQSASSSVILRAAAKTRALCLPSLWVGLSE